MRTRSITVAAVILVALSSCMDPGFGPDTRPGPEFGIGHPGGAPSSLPVRPGRNLLPNGSFERDGRPSLEGWRVNNAALTSVVPEPAPFGGRFALALEADWAPTSGYITAPIAVRQGGIFRLSASVRAVDADGGGVIALAVGKRYELAGHLKQVASAETEWRRVSLVDTVSVPSGDTLWVVLSSFHTEIARRRGLFDRVVLERLRPGGRVTPE